MRKRGLVTGVLTLVMSLGLTMTCFADAGISTEEQKILDALKAGITLENGTVVEIPTEYINKAQNYLAKEGNDLTDAAAKDVVAQIEALKKEVAATGVASQAELKTYMTTETAKADALLDKADKIAETAGISGVNFAIDNNGKVTEEILDKDGKVAADISSQIIKKTGADYTMTVVALAAVAALAGSCAVVARKKELFAKEA